MYKYRTLLLLTTHPPLPASALAEGDAGLVYKAIKSSNDKDIILPATDSDIWYSAC